MLKRVFIVAVLTCLAPGVSGAAVPCLTYEPATVELRGTVVRETFPGPPNYESVKEGDAPEVVWLLQLAEPICVSAKESDAEYPAASDLKRVQLVLTADEYKKFADLVGQPVVASGSLFAAHTGHHHADVLLTVEGMGPDPKK